MKRSFALKLLSSVFLTTVIISQSASGAQNQADALRRQARNAQNPAELTRIYNEANQLRPQVRQGALDEIHNKAVDLPMTSPGVVRPHNVPQNEFDAISQTREFKQLTNDQQTQVLAQLDHTIGARVAGPLQPAEVQAALNHVLGGAQAAALAGHVNGNLAHVAGGGGGGHGAGVGGGGHGAGVGGGGGAAVLIAQGPSGLQPAVYNALTNPVNHGPTTIAEQNAIMPLVVAAIAHFPGNQAGRDAAITAAVHANGNHPGYALAIINAVNAAHPIAGGGGGGAAVLAMPAGMNVNVYNAIIGLAGFGGFTIPEQNQILAATQAGINHQPAAGGPRNAAIGGRLTALGYPGITGPFRGQVIAAVNAHQPPHVAGGGGAGVGGGGGGGVVMPAGMNVPLFNALTAIPAFHGLPHGDQNLGLNAIQHVLGGAHPNYSQAREHAIVLGLVGTGVGAFGAVALQEDIIGAVNEHLPAAAIACPAVSDHDLVDIVSHLMGHGAAGDKFQPGGAGPLWRIGWMYNINAAGWTNHVVGNPAFNAYQNAVNPAMGAAARPPSNFNLDVRAAALPFLGGNIGNNTVMLTPANTAPGQAFEHAFAGDINTRRPACHYTLNVNQGGHPINMDLILTYGQED